MTRNRITVELTREQAEAELRFWRDLALWLADCHATAAEHAVTLRTTSASARDRLESICSRAYGAMTQRLPPDHIGRSEDVTCDRLRFAAQLLSERAAEAKLRKARGAR